MASPVRLACPRCGALNYATDDVCLNCGYDLPPIGPPEPVAPAPEPPPGPPEALVGEVVIERFECGPYLKHAVLQWVVLGATFLVLALAGGGAAGVPPREMAPSTLLFMAFPGAIVVLLPLIWMVRRARPGRERRLRFDHPVRWHAGPHELISVSYPGALAMGLLLGLIPGLLGGCTVILIAVVLALGGASEWPGLGAILLGALVGPPLLFGLAVLLLGATYNLAARAWGGVRFWCENRPLAPEPLAEPAFRGPTRATILFPEGLFIPAMFATGCGECVVQVIFAPVFLVAWAVLSLGLALLGGVRVEVR